MQSECVVGDQDKEDLTGQEDSKHVMDVETCTLWFSGRQVSFRLSARIDSTFFLAQLLRGQKLDMALKTKDEAIMIRALVRMVCTQLVSGFPGIDAAKSVSAI